MQDSDDIISKILTNQITKSQNSFESSCSKLPTLLLSYSIKDIASSVFTICLWLPNIASQVKFQFISSLFASLQPAEFNKTDKIISYLDFCNLYQEIVAVLPSFPMLEDYVPEPDWGNVKFFHDDNIYKIFYGNELSNVNEYLTIFQIIYCQFDKQYNDIVGRSPSLELGFTLTLQDDIITNISNQFDSEEESDLVPGHIELPPETFWSSSVSFYTHYNVRSMFGQDFVDRFSIQLGTYKFTHDYSAFTDSVFEGSLLPYFFIKHDKNYFPILPRRYSAILFDIWSKLYRTQVTGKRSYSFSIGVELYKYFKSRLNVDALFPAVSAVDSVGKPQSHVFPFAFITKNKLIIINMLNPGLCKKDIEDELRQHVDVLLDSSKLISRKPITLGVHVERQNVQFRSKNSKHLKPVFITIIPQVSTTIFSVSIPRKLPGYVMFMDSFLGIIDELDSNDMLSDFLDYYEKHKDIIHLPISLDVFGSFKNSYGVLIAGAREPNWISLDPHWGTRLRYETLASFWKIYPEKHFFDHPRSWKVEKDTDTRTRLIAKGYFGAALHCKIGVCNIFINSPFDKMSFEQGQISNMLMECLEDTLSNISKSLEKHPFFNLFEQVQFLIFPASLVASNDQFNHLTHLLPNNAMMWSIDSARLGPSLYGFRIVYDDAKLIEAMPNIQNRSIETDLAINVLHKVDEIRPDNSIAACIEVLKKQSSEKPRFKLFMKEKDVSFPDFVEIWEPESTHFKMARKVIAEQAMFCGISEGYYTLNEAKEKINNVRNRLVDIINAEVSKYNFSKSVPILLGKIDAVIDRYVRSSYTISKSLEHEVDYVREDSYANEHRTFITTHKNYRYLIEKFVQLQPNGKSLLNKESCQYLLALIDWLHVFYGASDSLHYGLNPVGMKVNDDFLIEAIYEDNPDEREKIFAEEHAKQQLGLLGNDSDNVSTNNDYSNLLDSLDKAFLQDFGFTFRCMINVLQVLSKWAGLNQKGKDKSSYNASESQIVKCCIKNLEGFKAKEIKLALDYLTLKHNEVLKLTDLDGVSGDLPVWEHNKRFSRYALRPLIKIGDKYYWGPHSVRKSGIIWSGNLTYGTLPIDIKSKSINSALRQEKIDIENAIVSKGEEIVARFTKYVRKNLELHKVPPKGAHPSELGDFDVFAYLPDKNVILNIECKDILPVFCLKDAKRLREKIFGRDGIDEGHFTQINKRQAYLEAHIYELLELLKWPVPTNKPKIIPIYLTKMTYWWTRFPPKQYNAVFLETNMLSRYLEEL